MRLLFSELATALSVIYFVSEVLIDTVERSEGADIDTRLNTLLTQSIVDKRLIQSFATLDL